MDASAYNSANLGYMSFCLKSWEVGTGQRIIIKKKHISGSYNEEICIRSQGVYSIVECLPMIHKAQDLSPRTQSPSFSTLKRMSSMINSSWGRIKFQDYCSNLP